MVLVKPQLRRHGGRHLLAVAGEHDRAPDAFRMQRVDGGFRVVFHHVGDNDVADVFPVERHVQNGAGKLAVMPWHAGLLHELAVAHAHHVLVHARPHAVAALLSHVGDARLVYLAGERLLHGKRDGMVGIRLGVRGDGKHKVGIHVRLRMHGDHVEGAAGERAGLVEHHGLGLRQRFEIVGTFHQNAQLGSAADAAEE